MARVAMLNVAMCSVMLLGVAGCGQTGPLYLPDDESATVITRPAADASSTPSTLPAPSVPPPAKREPAKPKPQDIPLNRP